MIGADVAGLTRGRSPSGSADRNTYRQGTGQILILSLPIRERGSKRLQGWRIRPARQSLPIRERGSKHRVRRLADLGGLSLPIRERGSKRSRRSTPRGRRSVAPHPGARIETPIARAARWCQAGVAPHPGARIETAAFVGSGALPASRSPSGSADRNGDGADDRLGEARRSPSGSADRNVLDYTIARRQRRRSPSGSADRNLGDMGDVISVVRRSPSGSADRNAPECAALGARVRRSPSGSADRNLALPPAASWREGRSPSGSADRNRAMPRPRTPGQPSLPIRERGSKLMGKMKIVYQTESLPIRERGSKRLGAALEFQRLGVAPHPGARIETVESEPALPQPIVAPHPGARIETSTSSSSWLTTTPSLPIRERGSKLRHADDGSVAL